MHDLDHILAAVTIAMPIVLGLAHALKSIARKLVEHAMTTPSTTDDKYAARLLTIADWLDAIVSAISDAATLGLTRRKDVPRADPNP